MILVHKFGMNILKHSSSYNEAIMERDFQTKRPIYVETPKVFKSLFSSILTSLPIPWFDLGWQRCAVLLSVKSTTVLTTFTKMIHITY